MKNLYLFVWMGLAVLSIQESVAQKLVVKGTVTDTEGHELPGVNVVVKGTSQGATTDGSGAYSISMDQADAALVFSFVGYQAKEEKPGSRAVLNVVLSTDDKTLNEVVVVGYGTQKKSDITGSIASVSAKELKNFPVARVDQALQGRSPGGGGAEQRCLSQCQRQHSHTRQQLHQWVQ